MLASAIFEHRIRHSYIVLYFLILFIFYYTFNYFYFQALMMSRGRLENIPQ